MGKQRDDGSQSVTQQVQSRGIDVKKSDKFSSEYNLSLLFYFPLHTATKQTVIKPAILGMDFQVF